MRKPIYIEDFCYDLNYKGIILYVGNVDPGHLRKVLIDSVVNKVYRLDYALSYKDPAMRNYIYVENCDLQDLSYPIYEYIEDGYDVYVLYEDDNKFYVKSKF